MLVRALVVLVFLLARSAGSLKLVRMITYPTAMKGPTTIKEPIMIKEQITMSLRLSNPLKHLLLRHPPDLLSH